MHNFSGHSLQFIVIFIIKTSVLLSRVLGSVHAVFVPVFQCHALKRHIGLLTKSATFFLHLISQIPRFHITMVSMDSE